MPLLIFLDILLQDAVIIFQKKVDNFKKLYRIGCVCFQQERGNTALHLAADVDSDMQISTKVCNVFLDKGVDWSIANKVSYVFQDMFRLCWPSSTKGWGVATAPEGFVRPAKTRVSATKWLQLIVGLSLSY